VIRKSEQRGRCAVPCDGEIDAEGGEVEGKIEIVFEATKSSGNKEVIARVDRAEIKSGSVEDHCPGSHSNRAAGSNEVTAAPCP
jgi:hypothetical protein